MAVVQGRIMGGFIQTRLIVTDGRLFMIMHISTEVPPSMVTLMFMAIKTSFNHIQPIPQSS